MPDLATHALIGLGVAFLVRKRAVVPPLLLGVVLPDTLSRVPSIVADKLYWYAEAFHTPFTMLLCCYLISLFFKTAIRKSMFGWMYLGTILHLIPDALQRHVSHGYFWLFPFSFFDYTWGLYWSEASLTVLPVLLVLTVILFVFQKRAHKL